MRDEANVSTEPEKAEEDPRVPQADEVSRRTTHPQAPPREGPQASERVIAELRATLPSVNRLRKRAEYRAVYDQGLRLAGEFLVMFVLEQSLGRPRLGVTATRRTGGAVRRNRARRLVREVFRHHRHELSSWDVVVNVKPAAAGCRYAQLEEDFLRLVHRASRRAGHAPGGTR